MSEKRILTNKEYNIFTQLCGVKQKGVLHIVKHFLEAMHYDEIIRTEHYLIGLGDIPVGLVAHADTVFTIPPDDIFYDAKKNVMWSPSGLGADDRAGIYAILKILQTGMRPHVIITTDEEKGCKGASILASIVPQFPKELKFLIQLDRRGHTDSVFYDCANSEFEQYINSFQFTTSLGSFSDISVLGPAWGVAAVNLSIGYIHEHTAHEHLYLDSMFNTINKVIQILADAKKDSCPVFEYIDALSSNPMWMDDGYNLTPIGNVCTFCNGVHRMEDLLPIKVNEHLTAYICNSCYGHFYKSIEWCDKCNEGWLITQNDLEFKKDNKWFCRVCREDNKIDNG